jgi:hypothetical protein
MSNHNARFAPTDIGKRENVETARTASGSQEQDMSIRGKKGVCGEVVLREDPLQFFGRPALIHLWQNFLFQGSETVCVRLVCFFVMWMKSVGFLLLFYIFCLSQTHDRPSAIRVLCCVVYVAVRKLMACGHS